MFAVQERGDSFLRIVKVECPVLCGSNGIVNPIQHVKRQDHDELKNYNCRAPNCLGILKIITQMKVKAET